MILNYSRKYLFDRQLAVGLTVLADSLKAGKSLEQALRLLAGQSPDQLGAELTRVIREIEQGTTLEQALSGMAGRVDSSDFDLFLAAVAGSLRNEGNLAGLVDSVACTIRARDGIDVQTTQLVTSGWLGGLVIALLPVALGLVFSILQSEMMLLFVSRPLGQMLLGLALVLLLLGFFSIRWLTAGKDRGKVKIFRRADKNNPDRFGCDAMRPADGGRRDSLAGEIHPAVAWLTRFRRGREKPARVAVIRQTLPEALDLLVALLEAGLDADQALARLVEKCEGPLADEFARALGEMRHGDPRASALQKITVRVRLDELDGVITAIIRADRAGIGLAADLRRQVEQLRIARRQRLEQEARLVPIKLLFPMVLFTFPTIFIIILGPIVVKVSYVKEQIGNTEIEQDTMPNQDHDTGTAEHKPLRARGR